MRGSKGIWLVVAAFVAACGSNESAPELSVSETNFCDEIAEVACHDMYSCCSEGEIESVLGVDEPRTEGQCREDLAIQCRRAVATFDWSVENGRARFEAATAQTCLAAFIAGDQCELVATTTPWQDDCVNELWTGLVPDGGECFQPYECAGADSYCAANRICTPRPGDGMPCRFDGCATGFYCDDAICRPRRALGESCVTPVDCVVGLYCDFTADPEPVCTARAAVGEACSSDATCTTAECIPGVCNLAETPCFLDSDCDPRCADSGAFCNSDAQCSDFAGTCSIGGAACDDPLDCAGEGNTCVFPIACLPGDCVGDPVCGERYFTTDFCDDALDDLPVSFGLQIAD